MLVACWTGCSGGRPSPFLGCELCAAKSLTFSGFMANPPVGKKFSSPNSQAKCTTDLAPEGRIIIFFRAFEPQKKGTLNRNTIEDVGNYRELY